MKKVIMVSLFALVTMMGYGQKFTYKRIFYSNPEIDKINEKQNYDGLTLLITGSPNILKIKGEVTITDTTIDLVTEGIVSNYKVITISKGLYQGQNVQQFKMKANEDIDFRFSLSPNPNPSKK